MAREPGDIVQIADSNKIVINPATKEKQDEMVSSINSLAGASAVRIDEASSTITYVGKAVAGTLDSDSAWQIFKMDTSSGLEITWPDGESSFTFVWDDRVSLSYT